MTQEPHAVLLTMGLNMKQTLRDVLIRTKIFRHAGALPHSAETCSTIMATNRPKTNVKYMACTVETDTLLYVLAGCVSASSEPRRRRSSLSLSGSSPRLPTATADKSQHQEWLALMMQLSYADVAQ